MSKLNSIKLLLLGFISTLFVACTSNSSSGSQPAQVESAHDAFVSSLSAADSAQVLSLCNDFFASLKSGEMDKAFGMLSELDSTGTLIPLNADQVASLQRRFTMFPVCDYSLKEFTLGDNCDNVCSFSIKISPEDNSRISFALNPVMIGCNWHLTVRNAGKVVTE